MTPVTRGGWRSAAPARGAALLLVVLPLVMAAGCEHEAPPAASTRHGRERVLRDLVFYPRAEEAGGSFFLDRFEAMRGDFAQWLQHRPEAATTPAVPAQGPLPGDALPVTSITLGEARRFATWCFTRLPRSDEWVYAATGSGLYHHPWGDSKPETFANTLELDLGRLHPGGTFESGREPGKSYDLLGNAAEWSETVPAWFFADVDADRPVNHRAGVRVLRALGLTAEGWPAPAAWIVAASGNAARREVLGGHCAMTLDESVARAAPKEFAPGERHNLVGFRVAADPRGLLEALLRAGRDGDVLEPELEPALRRFLRQPEPRAALRAAYPAAMLRVPARGPFAGVLAAELGQ